MQLLSDRREEKEVENVVRKGERESAALLRFRTFVIYY